MLVFVGGRSPPEPPAPRPSAIRYASPKPVGPEPAPKAKPVSKDFAKFNQTTKGFGLQMLLKMGYKPVRSGGQTSQRFHPHDRGSQRAATRTPTYGCIPQGLGLGPRGQGIAEPIEVKQRPKSMGLAFRDFDEKTEQAKKDEKRKTKEARGEVDDEEPNVAAWRADAQRTGKGRKGRRGRKTVYKTVEEILQENAEKDGAAPPPPDGGMKIVDMTGPEVRVVTTTDKKASQRVAYYSTSQHFPELRHNLRLIVDAAGTTRDAGSWRGRTRADHDGRAINVGSLCHSESEIQAADRAMRQATQRAEQFKEAKQVLVARLTTATKRMPPADARENAAAPILTNLQ